ncbi:MAG: fumarylacetoacetate hydrolase family protein [Rhodobacteraceae bacterium]|nr:fumarylacetoacetate hydrolase family protein [Paracoccaceae bacterium]
MNADDIAACARMLHDAERGGRQCGLISRAHPAITLDQAYAVQAGFVALRRAAGAVPIGWKIGLTSRAMQQALDIDTPDSGVLMSDMAFAQGATVPARRFIQPRVEAEIAFVMKTGLAGAGVTRDDVIAATDHVVAALEILDTRILRRDPDTGQARVIFDTVADNAANAGLVLGDARHAVAAQDLRRVGAIVKRDGVVEETGLGAGVLDDPVRGIVWLVRRLAAYGQGLAAGEIVLSGSFVRPVEAPPGSVFDADFGDFGRVAIGFA